MRSADLGIDKRVLRRIRPFGSFRAFAAILGHRITNGRSHEVFCILVRIGFTERWAWEIVEFWPMKRTRVDRILGCTPEESRALFLAIQIANCFDYDALDADWLGWIAETVNQ